MNKNRFIYYLICAIWGVACNFITGFSVIEGWQWWAAFIPFVVVAHSAFMGESDK